MNTKRTLKWGLLAAATCVAVAAVPGCELLVDFDRSKIPSGDGGETDGTMPQPDGPVETGGETGSEASMGDAPSEASEASTGDAPEEMAADGPEETTTTEGGMDAQPEGGTEAGMEAGMEAGPEAGGDGSDGAMGAASFSISPASLDYGTVAQGQATAAYSFTVTNTGTAGGTPTVTKGGTNPGDYTTSGCTSAVLPTTTCTLSVTFTPGGAGTRGPATIGVDTAASTSVTGTGAATGSLSISPMTQDFGSITNGMTSTDFTFTVTNTDAVNAVNVGTIKVDGQDLGGFVIDLDGGAGQCSGTLAPGGTCTLFLHFAPTGVAGKPYYASLSITGTATDGGSSPGTATASLTGKAN
ncbi:MAG TPA: choice-of-anchor D domain-containing protein [Polyangiaceae bacterium]